MRILLVNGYPRKLPMIEDGINKTFNIISIIINCKNKTNEFNIQKPEQIGALITYCVIIPIVSENHLKTNSK
jgi:hypothetical protein